MKIPMGFWAAVALLALAQAAQAAPKVSGKYVLMVFTQCEASLTTTMGSYLKPGNTQAPAVRLINPAQSGELNIGVGSITFPAVAASAGNASFEAFLVSGGALRINTSGNPMAAHTEAAAGPFSFTNTTFTFRPVGEPAMTWTMRAGDIVANGGVARTLYLVRREDARCVNAITATKQLQ